MRGSLSVQGAVKGGRTQDLSWRSPGPQGKRASRAWEMEGPVWRWPLLGPVPEGWPGTVRGHLGAEAQEAGGGGVSGAGLGVGAGMLVTEIKGLECAGIEVLLRSQCSVLCREVAHGVPGTWGQELCFSYQLQTGAQWLFLGAWGAGHRPLLPHSHCPSSGHVGRLPVSLGRPHTGRGSGPEVPGSRLSLVCGLCSCFSRG